MSTAKRKFILFVLVQIVCSVGWLVGMYRAMVTAALGQFEVLPQTVLVALLFAALGMLLAVPTMDAYQEWQQWRRFFQVWERTAQEIGRTPTELNDTEEGESQ